MQITSAPLLDDEYVRRLYRGQRVNLASVTSAYFRRLFRLIGSRSFDLLWVEKELFPWFPAVAERVLSFLRIPYVVDYDDAVFHRYDEHRNRLVRLALGHKIDAVMGNASLVIAGNEYLASRARDAGARRVEILPSVVDLDRFHSPAARNSGAGANPERFTIGWIGSPVTAPYLSLVREPLEAISSQGGVELVLIGAGSVDPLPGLPKKTILWSEAQEAELLASLDVGIMPLPDSPFERGKCGYKLVQYMAAGLPVIASAVGVNTRIVEHDRTGFLASNPQEWLDALQMLKDEPQKRAQLGAAGRQRAEESYSLELTAPKLFDLLCSATG